MYDKHDPKAGDPKRVYNARPFKDEDWYGYTVDEYGDEWVVHFGD